NAKSDISKPKNAGILEDIRSGTGKADATLTPGRRTPLPPPPPRQTMLTPTVIAKTRNEEILQTLRTTSRPQTYSPPPRTTSTPEFLSRIPTWMRAVGGIVLLLLLMRILLLLAAR